MELGVRCPNCNAFFVMADVDEESEVSISDARITCRTCHHSWRVEGEVPLRPKRPQN